MTTLAIPLLRSVKEQLAEAPVQGWPPPELQMFRETIQVLRNNTASLYERLENRLAEGVEARSFARDSGPLLAAADDQLGTVQELVEKLMSAEDLAAESLVGQLRSLQQELCSLKQEMRAYRDLLADALSRASAAPGPIDWERVRAAEEAYAGGKTKRFSRR